MIRSCCKTTQAREINPILENLRSFSKTSAEIEKVLRGKKELFNLCVCKAISKS